jgi:hypothetical protein
LVTRSYHQTLANLHAKEQPHATPEEKMKDALLYLEEELQKMAQKT